MPAMARIVGSRHCPRLSFGGNMEFKTYTIVYQPFPESDMTCERTLLALDYQDALAEFRKMYPAMQIKSVTEE
jgi:hypothetical protein